jgi:hypothetical protein
MITAVKGTPAEIAITTYAAEMGYPPEDPYWEATAPVLLSSRLLDDATARLRAEADRLGRPDLPDSHTPFSLAIEAIQDPELKASLNTFREHVGAAVSIGDAAWLTTAPSIMAAEFVRASMEKILKADVLLRRELADAKKVVETARQLKESIDTNTWTIKNTEPTRKIWIGKLANFTTSIVAATLVVVALGTHLFDMQHLPPLVDSEHDHLVRCNVAASWSATARHVGDIDSVKFLQRMAQAAHC